eukprot:535836-Amphidinium_carterae.1
MSVAKQGCASFASTGHLATWNVCCALEDFLRQPFSVGMCYSHITGAMTQARRRRRAPLATRWPCSMSAA